MYSELCLGRPTCRQAQGLCVRHAVAPVARGGCRMSDLYKVMLLKDQHCILILGLDNAVRTTVLERSKTRFHKNSKGRSLSKITATVGLNISTVDVGKARLLLCGLAGGRKSCSLYGTRTKQRATASSMSWAPRRRDCPSTSVGEDGHERGAGRRPHPGAGQQAGR